MGSDSLFFIIIAVCLIMSAYFSATETAFLSLNRIRMKNMADKGNKRAALVLELEEKYDNLLSTILIGNNIVNILSSSLATILFVKILGDAKGASVSTIVTTVLVLIFGEISPKSIAKESPDKFALFSAPIISVLVKILTPLNFVLHSGKNCYHISLNQRKRQESQRKNCLRLLMRRRQAEVSERMSVC